MALRDDTRIPLPFGQEVHMFAGISRESPLRRVLASVFAGLILLAAHSPAFAAEYKLTLSRRPLGTSNWSGPMEYGPFPSYAECEQRRELLEWRLRQERPIEVKGSCTAVGVNIPWNALAVIASFIAFGAYKLLRKSKHAGRETTAKKQRTEPAPHINPDPTERQPDGWLETTTTIAHSLEQGRKEWFDSCVALLEAVLPGKIANRSPAGPASLAMKAYQLWWTTAFIAEKAYVPVSQWKDFAADVLYAQVCGPELHEVWNFVRRYDEAAADRATQLYRFTSDVARHVLGTESPLVEGLGIGAAVPRFVFGTKIVVASAFGDQATVQLLLSELDRYWEKVRPSPEG